MLVGEGPPADAKRRLLERAGARIVGPDDPAMLAVVAADDPPLVARLKARGLLVNVVDRPDLCDFTFPAIVDRDPVLVAVGTGGASAGLAAALRQRLELLLPAQLGRIADALNAARDRLRELYPDAGVRRRAIAALLAPGGALDPLQTQDDPALTLADDVPPSRLERVAIRSADPDELTVRAARLLALADRIYHPADMPRVILDRARADAERIAGPPPAQPEPGLIVALDWSRT
jgi:uroporphyrin-III C-methyltransferase/precorrin-2 dehydrogenase/sirohydrochlorin ferrochelatase